MDLPREAGLQVRMGVALALSAVLLAACAGALAYLALFVPDGWSLAAFIGLILFVGWARAAQARRRRTRRQAPEEMQERARRAVERIAVVADVPAPQTDVVPQDVPLSWTVAPLWGTPTVHMTTGLLERLGDRELQAVVAHEMGHLLHRDAIVMTLVAGPPASFFGGLRGMVEHDAVRGVMGAAIFGLTLGVPAGAMLLLSRVVSRHRELAADRAAALLTGSPEAVAAALIAVDDGLRAQRDKDLRLAAPRDAFHFVAARRERVRLWATHPSLRERLARL